MDENCLVTTEDSVPQGSPAEEALDRLAECVEWLNRDAGLKDRGREALATVRERLERLTEERDEQVAVAEDIARACFDWKNRAESAESEVSRLIEQRDKARRDRARFYLENGRLTAELQHTREGLRDAAEAEEHLAARARSDVDYEGAAIHSHAASVLRALLAVSSVADG